jgi:predicted enzyme related to lactoylglutathione lyase
MTSTTFGISYDAHDAKEVATFWAAVLDRSVTSGADADNATVEAGATGPRIGFHRVPEAKTVKNRMHLDLITTDFAEELSRLTTLGATSLNEVNAGGHWVNLADPEGNEFDLIDG